MQARREVREQECADDVRGEGRPGPLSGVVPECLREAGARDRADEAAGEDGRKLAAVEAHGSSSLGWLVSWAGTCSAGGRDVRCKDDHGGVIGQRIL